jgi:hypothetical protein
MMVIIFTLFFYDCRFIECNIFYIGCNIFYIGVAIILLSILGVLIPLGNQKVSRLSFPLICFLLAGVSL